MRKEAIGTGETLEKAKEEACRILGVDADKAEFDVIQMPEKKVLGLFGGKEAKVMAYYEVTPVDKAKEYLESIIKSLNLNGVEVELTEQTEDSATFVINGEEATMLIGRRGETLDSLQYLVGLVANYTDDSYYRISLDTGDYRKKREEVLKSLGKKHAIIASKRGYKHSFEPMNPYERRIIHTAVQEIEGAVSWSEGDGINRHVIIGPDPSVKRQNRSRGGYRGNKYGNTKRNNNVKSENVTEKRPAKAVDDLSSKGVSLYSKIEL